MNSSGSLFTKQNPFQSKPMVGKTHCHSSHGQSLSKTKKKTTLSPVRSNRDNPKSHRVSPKSQRQVKRQDGHCDTTDGEPVFSEIWPSTECGSSPISNTASSDMEANIRRHSEVDVQPDSVLAKYIERFRHGQPQSREERQQDHLPFWWTTPSSLPPSSTSSKSTNRDIIPPLRDDHGPAVFKPAGQRYSDRSPSPHRGSLTILSDTSQGDFEDSEIIHLQEKASRLLQRGECTLSDGSIPVTSAGLGSSDFSSPVSVDEPVRRPFIPSLLTCTSHAKTGTDLVQAVTFQKSAVIPTLAPPNRPEEDILFQWRLRRKMEKARESAQTFSHSSLHSSAFQWQVHNLPASEQSHKQKQSIQTPESSQRATYAHMDAPHSKTREQPCLTSPNSTPSPAFVASSSLISHPQAITHVPAHMHFLCDVLPCPSQSSHANMQQNISQRLGPSTKVKTPAAQTLERIHMSPSEPSSSGGIEGGSAPHPKETEMNMKVKAPTKYSEKDKRKAATSTREQKKSTRVPKKVITTVEQQRLQRYLDSSSQNSHHPPPPSPIHSALGEVVSEVLFPSTDSSPAQRSSLLPVCPPGTTSEPPQSSVSLCNTQNPMEVISQLLQEAEDSDEKEFEDDPLLQVLRKQRKWVKEQISEVDMVLHGLLDQQQIT
ncbi:proline and serine-rich protein 3 [Sphaeramia orbicularis]|uniref:proline and serine-rich protein 3 n=1 Tax=Sphaeramia orbicularis TaxID=375764 RepID=UPI00118032AF|nr:proline and serine-rich protein 3 [Sphaeramia orbicularis]